ncbi:MFS transporter [Anderseniella sp. Alg231-50]|uniref:MFS transporter n=1 Tax=Anderseniella sp. Alg231-50 TaxID=1922226 RepID=UPI00307C2123
MWAALYYSFPALLVQWEQEFGWSKTGLTGAFTLAVLTSAVMAPLTGRLIDRGFGTIVFGGSAFLGAVLLALLTQVTQLWQFYLVWFGIGVTLAGCLYEPCFAILTRTLGNRARRGITIVSLMAGLAGTVSFPAAFYLSNLFGWRGAVLVFAAVIVVLAVPLICWAASRAEQTGGSASAPSSRNAKEPMRIARKPAFWALALGLAMISMNTGIMITHTIPLLGERGFARETAVLAISMIGPMQVVGRTMIMGIEHRVPSLVIAISCQFAMSAAALSLMGAAALPVLLASFVFLQGVGNGVTSIMRPVLTAELLGRADFGVISGMTAMVYISGFAAGPTIGSLAWQVGGYDLMLFMSVGIGALGALLMLAAGRLSAGNAQLSSGSTGG